MSLDVVALGAAKKYTDEQIEKSATGGIDLSGYYTKEEIDAMNFVTGDELPEGSIVDKTLTIEGQAADAKVTGDRLLNVEYQTITTDLAYEHKDLPEEKTVTIYNDGTWNTSYINFGENLMPSGGLSKSFPFNGITVTKRGNSYLISGTATKNGVVMFTDKDGNYNIPVDSSLIGKTVNMYSFADSAIGTGFGWKVTFFNSEGASLSNKSTYVANSKNNNMASIVIPENTSYMQWSFNFSLDKTLNNEVQFIGAIADNVQSVTLDGETTEVTNVANTKLSTFPCKSTVSYIVSLSEYITNFAGGDTATYLTPEAFGAVGDGGTDDIEAIIACLAVASETKQTVLMARKYYVSMPIDINSNGLNVYINDVVYSGTDAAVKIHGKQNTIKIHSITSSGIGVKFLGDGTEFSKWTLYNNLEINTIAAVSHGIVFECSTAGMYQNTVRFNYIKAGGDGCYGIAYFNLGNIGSLGENNFYGGHITCCDWAVYRVGGNSKLYSLQIEGDVKGGFYIDGYVTIFHPRITEGQRDGEFPFYKFTRTDYVTIYDTVGISINQIDLTEAKDVFTNESGVEYPLHENDFGKINARIISRIPEVGVSPINNVYCTTAYVWGKYLIMQPYMTYRKEVTTETLDTRLVGTEGKDEGSKIHALSQLPTKFVINTANTEIHLHESYCAFGFNEFEVEQANGFTCKVYDKLNNLIFDGTDKGDGFYKFKVYKDAEYCGTNSSGLLRRDFLGHYWEVTKEITVDDVLNALPTWTGGAY